MRKSGSKLSHSILVLPLLVGFACPLSAAAVTEVCEFLQTGHLFHTRSAS